MAIHVNHLARWKNFRSFEDTGWLEFRPLTILIGPNNVGKTSVFAPILLLNQTLSSKDIDTPLVTRGSLVDIGSYANFIHCGEIQKGLSLEFYYHAHDADNADDKIKKTGSYPPGGIELEFSYDTECNEILLKKYALVDIFKRPYLSQLRTSAGNYSLRGLLDKSKFKDVELKTIKTASPTNFLFSPTSTIHSFNKNVKQDTAREVSDFSPEFSHYLQAIGFAFQELRDIFNDLCYIGPLREKTRRHYDLPAETPKTVGIQGGNAANLIYRKYDEFSGALNEWVRRFEFGDSIELSPSSSGVFSLSFFSKANNRKTNIADAGFGASQVLPLIVQALAAPEGSVTIAEQPEIHLNPRLQSVLADLFVEMVSNDHRVIIETHSEHLLLRLRRLIAEGKIQSNKVSLYFVEQIDGVGKVSRIEIDDNGHIPSTEWPKGFFEESLDESIALARAQSKSAKDKKAT